MKDIKFERKGNQIKNLETGEVTKHKSINLAKKASHKLQKDTDGTIGRGCLRVVEKFSKAFTLTG